MGCIVLTYSPNVWPLLWLPFNWSFCTISFQDIVVWDTFPHYSLAKTFRAQTQSGAMTAASHFIKAESALQRNSVPQLGGNVCVIRCPEQMKYGATRWSRLLYLQKGYFPHGSVIWNLVADNFVAFQIKLHLMVCDGLCEGAFHLSEHSLKVFNFEFKIN